MEETIDPGGGQPLETRTHWCKSYRKSCRGGLTPISLFDLNEDVEEKQNLARNNPLAGDFCRAQQVGAGPSKEMLLDETLLVSAVANGWTDPAGGKNP